LVANKFWYRRGGLEHVMFDEIDWLEAAGHEIAHFSTAHPSNEPSPWSVYFADYVELGQGSVLRSTQRAAAAARMFYNAQAARRIASLIRCFRPDVIHFHGIHRQLSPSVMMAARRHGVPAVQSFHDYQAVCSADVLLRGGRESCLPPRCTLTNSLPCFVHRCVRGSRSASALGATEFEWRRKVCRSASLIDLAVTPSRHLARAMQTSGWKGAPLRLLPNATTMGPPASTTGEFFLYAGRLSPEKGVLTLLDAAGAGGAQLVLAGEGPLRQQLEESAATRRVSARFLGRVSSREVGRLVSGCRAVVVPSTCVENAPLAVLEAMARAKPVIASHVGGIPEQVTDGVEGLLVPPGDPVSLAAAMRRLADDASLAGRLGESGRVRALASFSPEVHVRRLIEIYKEAIDRRKGGSRRRVERFDTLT
jgi:glycosyltransferase involved in cell wall biosynthesis